jgi:large subunit ribosomal protein L4
MKRLALRGALTAKLNDGAIKILDAFALEEIRTKDLLGVLGNLQASGRVLIVASARDEKLDLSARNLPAVEVLLADSLNIVDLLKADIVVIEQPALARLEEVYA